MPHLLGSEVLRASSIALLSSVAVHCSDGGGLEPAVTLLLDSLSGKGQKLTSSEHRSAIISALGTVAAAPLSKQSRSEIAEKVIDPLVAFVSREVHEGTQMEAAALVAKYASFLASPKPSLVAAIKTLLEDSKSKIAVVLNYTLAANALFAQEGRCPFADSLVKYLDRLPAPGSHPSVPSVAAVIMHILLKCAAGDHSLLTRVQAAKWWNSVADAVLFEKLGLSQDARVAQVFIDTCVGLFNGSLSIKLSAAQTLKWANVLAALLVHRSWEIRKVASNKLRQLLSLGGYTHIAIALTTALTTLMETPPGASENAPANSPSVLLAGLRSISVCATTDDAQGLALSLVLPSHHPALNLSTSPLPSLWSALHIDPVKGMAFHAAAIGAILVDADLSKQSLVRSTLKQLGALDVAAPVRKWLVQWACERISDPSVNPIGAHEVAVWKWKEGVLFTGGSQNDDNLDRNSKDYAEKKWEMELRKELAQKKGGKVEAAAPAAKLTKKQEEQQRAQIQKESAIRAEVSRVDKFLATATLVISGLLDGNAKLLGVHTALLSSTLLSRVRSELFAEQACKLFVRLSSATTIDPASLGSTVGIAIVRVKSPACTLSLDWRQEDLNSQIARVMRLLFTLSHSSALSASSFVYSFPLVEYILRSSSLAPAVLEDALVFMNAHVDLGASIEVTHSSVLVLLIHVIGHHSRLAHQASILLGDYCQRLSSLFTPVTEQNSALLHSVVSVLVDGIYHPTLELRSAAVRSLSALPLPSPATAAITSSVWLAMHDQDSTISGTAKQIWTKYHLAVDDDISTNLIDSLLSSHDDIRSMAARALNDVLVEQSTLVDETVSTLLSKFVALQATPEPLRDELGNVLPVQPPDPWEGRCGICEAFATIALLLNGEQIEVVTTLFVDRAVGDRSEKVQTAALKASIAVVDAHGKDYVTVLLPILESRSANLSKSDGRHDIVRQSVVVLLGTLAKHLDKTDAKVPSIVSTLLGTLWTPSQPVQEAVANCLAPLAPAVKEGAGSMISNLMLKLLDGESYGIRRGAAYGIAGLVKGLSILALKQYSIMDTLLEAVQDKKRATHREGALMALELLCLFLGRLFEPYVIHVLPHLLICYGDGNADVRSAAEDTASAIMSKLSAHGVKLVLPALLTGLDDDSWRTKAGSVELLGAMANCAPKQLSACLPSIVPRLASVLTDSHAKVQQAGRDALTKITQVMKNPEVMNIAPTILNALSDPANKTQACLEALLQTAFVHVIDAPSLAIIMPVLQRGLIDRSSDTKMRSAQIIGNMYNLTDPKDLAPYMDDIIPGLQAALTDPVPEVRAVASKALGAMFKGLGEEASGSLIPWLLETLRSDTSTVDRAGAAQGLSEVLYALGVDRLSALMESFIAGTMRPQSFVREGHFLLFVYLPATFGELFRKFVPSVVPCVLRGLADVEESVRDSATRTGQRIISHFSDQSVELLLPELEEGMQHEHWRIRQSSIHLLGDLLYKISGVSGNKTTEGDDDDNFGTELSHNAILSALGTERRDRVYSRIYIARSDTQLPVRQAALHVWKVVVTHTVRTLRDIMPVLIKIVLGNLASEEAHLKVPAARTLGELVRKLGERVLPDILPILEAGLGHEDVSRRQGVCIALVEIMESCNREVITQFAPSLIPAVQRALCDSSPLVREAAANTFSSLHNCIGAQTIDDILPQLLAGLSANDATSEATLDGLRLIMTSKSKVLLPFLVPRLLQQPISAVNAKALASLTAVAGPALAKYITQMLQTLLDELQRETTVAQKEVRYAARVLVLSVDETGFLDVLTELLAACAGKNPRRRSAAIVLLSDLCQETQVDFSQHINTLLRGLMKLFTDANSEVLAAAWAGVSAVLAKSPAEEKPNVLRNLHQTLRNIATDRNWEPLPGFSLPRGLEPFIAIYCDGLQLNGTDVKEMAAEGLGYLTRLTKEEDLAAYSLKMTGPLIRASSEGMWQVRAATLSTLVLLLKKIPVKLKAFIPQLQPTCVKALKESTRAVRDRAAEALTHIIMLQKDRRIDPLLTELLTASKGADPSIRATIYITIQCALHNAGTTATDPVKKNVKEALIQALRDEAEEVRVGASKALASLAALSASKEELASLITSEVLPTSSGTNSWMLDHSRATVMSTLAWLYGDKLLQLGHSFFIDAVARWIKHEHFWVISAGCATAVGILHWVCKDPSQTAAADAVAPLLGSFLASSSNSDAVRGLMSSYVQLGKETDVIEPRIYALILPPLMTVLKFKSGTVKTAIDRALVHLLQLRRDQSALEAAVAALGTDGGDLRAYHRKTLAERASVLSDDESSDA